MREKISISIVSIDTESDFNSSLKMKKGKTTKKWGDKGEIYDTIIAEYYRGLISYRLLKYQFL